MKVTDNGKPFSIGDAVLTFGPFRLDVVQHVLWRGDKQLHLGSRALEILITLAQRSGEIVSKDELIARIWPKSIVQEATLRVHVSALRKVLGDGESGTPRYIENFSGRGYRFVARVTREQSASSTAEVSAASCSITQALTFPRARNLPAPPTRIVGRAQAVDMLAARIPQRCFVTIVGSGGIGKTTVALAVAHKLSAAYRHGVQFVDLSMLTGPCEIIGALAAALGLTVPAEDALPAVLTFLEDKSLLLLFDNCEHVVESAARVAEKVLQAAPEVHVLATSREPLRAEGEYVHRLLPLEFPEHDDPVTRTEALAFPAIEYFVEQAMTNLDSFDLRDADIPAVAEICRRLDGNPLALKLAAARVDPFGLQGLVARLDDCLQFLTRGRRTALPRHQTLRAMLDWSYDLLSPLEQVALRRVALFPGSFDLQSSGAVLADEKICAFDVLDILTNLVAKSLMIASTAGVCPRYRLPDMTRAYALEKLRDSGELASVTERYMEVCTLDEENSLSPAKIALAA